jgi:4-amino-4-deoxy-L-arabinose transferase-like glycosyltransferase
VLAVALAATGACAYELLQRTPDWQPWLAPTILVSALVIASALLVGPWLSGRTGRVIAALGVVVALAGSASYAFATATTDHSGAIPSAGPASAASFGRGGPFGGFGPPGGGAGAGRFPGGARGGFAGGFPGGGGGAGGLLDGSTPTGALTQTLQKDADSYTWVAATIGSNTASGYQLATGDPVMSIGGFNGTDPAPTLAQFQAYVSAGRIHYFIAGGGRGRGFGGGAFGQGGTGSTSSQITSWVESNFESTTVGGITLYDLTT